MPSCVRHGAFCAPRRPFGSSSTRSTSQFYWPTPPKTVPKTRFRSNALRCLGSFSIRRLQLFVGRFTVAKPMFEPNDLPAIRFARWTILSFGSCKRNNPFSSYRGNNPSARTEDMPFQLAHTRNNPFVSDRGNSLSARTEEILFQFMQRTSPF